MQEMRLNKYLAECGVCSRREADRLIEAGKVSVNGKTAGLGVKVDGTEEIYADGVRVKGTAKKVVLAFYKPPGLLVSESDPHAEETILDHIDYPIRVTYAGRLDKESEGLILLTNDGDLIHAMMQGSKGHEKEYIVHLDREPMAENIEKLKKGVYLPDLKRKTKPCRIEKISRYVVRMVLTEGLNRQIRRMWAQENFRIRALKRTRVLNITLGNLQPGEYCELTAAEMRKLYQAAGLKAPAGQ
ncbi:MAG: rRNA pseudouridine synthase [Lachnospiraceae bacterium]|nr:rRNA pseudouridine synthase [Lachnospiraceae bacterium]